MRFDVQLEVTPQSKWLDGTSDLKLSLTDLTESERCDLVKELIWRRIGNKEPLLNVVNVSQSQ